MLDTTVLRLLKYRDKFDLYHRAVPEEALEAHTRILLKDLGRFFEETDAPVASPDAFGPWFKLARPKLKPEAASALQKIIENMGPDVPEAVEVGILARLEDARQALTLTGVLERYQAGEEVSIAQAVTSMAESMPLSRGALPKVRETIEDELDASENDWGFHWRLSCLNASTRPLRPGDFVIVGARVDTGKSSFFASEGSFMAQQIDTLFPGEDRPFVVLNNESLGVRLKTRFVQATLNMDIDEMVQARKKGKDLYAEAMKVWGGRNVLEVYDIHDRPLSFLENIVRRRNPAIVVVDMLDNVPFDGAVGNGGQRTDQVLEAAYQRARLWAVKYNCVVFAMSQLNAEASGVLYPGQHMLANSRTGKPGAADLILMIGASDDPLLGQSRWISLPKNKLTRPRGVKDPRAEVIFDGPRGRFNNPKELT